MSSLISRDRTENPQEHFPTAMDMAVVVLMERLQSLSMEDKNDLFELVPALCSSDQEERNSAIIAFREIITQEPVSVSVLKLEEASAEGFQRWKSFAGGRIREARETAKKTQAELAQETGIPQSHISRLERGEHSPSHRTLEKIAAALNVEVKAFAPSLGK